MIDSSLAIEVPSQRGRGQIQGILTVRGAVLFALSIYLILGPLVRHHDIVAGVVAFALGGVIILVALVTLLIGMTLRRAVSCSIKALPIPPADEMRSGEDIRMLLKLSKLSIPPLFKVTIKVTGRSYGAPSLSYALTGQVAEGATIDLRAKFPRRGYWEFPEIVVEFGDRSGLSEYRWSIDNSSDAPTRVTYPFADGEWIPVVSSSSKPGDELSSPRDRVGDPLDLKPYHPSDGLKKILWKLYAKRGELVSRHPERSMTPEGETVVYALTRPNDDHLSGVITSFAAKVLSVNCGIVVGIDGLKDEKFGDSIDSIEELLVLSGNLEATDDANSDEIESNFTEFIGRLQRRRADSTLVKVIVAVEADWAARNSNLIRNIGAIADRNGISPFFVLTDLNAHRSAKVGRTPGEKSRAGVFKSLFRKGSSTKNSDSTKGTSELTRLIYSWGWESVIEE